MADRVFQIEVPVLCNHCGRESGATKGETVSLDSLLRGLSRPGATPNERISKQVIQQLWAETPTYDRT